MEDDKEMYEAFIKMWKMVDIMYDAYEEWEKERVENDAPSTLSNEQSSPSSYSHHSNEEINKRLQGDNAKLKVLLWEEKEEKKWL